jgi:flavin-dependent dehydrogenase
MTVATCRMHARSPCHRSGQLAAETAHAYLEGGRNCQADLEVYNRRVNAELVAELERARLFSRLFYWASGLFYRFGVRNARVNPWIGELLTGRKTYLDVFRELVTASWMLGS